MDGTGIDHLVVAAETLDRGTAYIFETLGVMIQPGGEHPAMGTHNRLLKIGPECYLEVIAVQPGVPQPSRPRWFGLDTEELRTMLCEKPRLVTWAVHTDRIGEMSQKSVFPLGRVEPMSRGNLTWRLTLTGDGSLPGGGLVPFLIDWGQSTHPAAGMPESGCSLVKLAGIHPASGSIRAALASLGLKHLIDLRPGPIPSLSAVIRTPLGVKILA